MKSIFVFLSIIVISSCSLFDNQDFIITETIENKHDAINLVASTIRYVSDASDKFQYPKETYESKKGDCEDKASLLAYIFESILYMEDVFVVFCYDKGRNAYHVLTEAEDEYYESITGENITDIMNNYIIISNITVNKYMNLVMLDNL